MIYPLSLSFKIVALAPQIFVRDANGQSICYVKQKLFKLKEAVKVYGDESKSQILCEMNADRIIDWSATYRFSDADGEIFGSVRRKGTRSFWKAHYEIFDEDEVGSYNTFDDLGSKIEFLLSNEKKINQYGKNGKMKYFKLFNNKIVSNKIISNTF